MAKLQSLRTTRKLRLPFLKKPFSFWKISCQHNYKYIAFTCNYVDKQSLIGKVCPISPGPSTAWFKKKKIFFMWNKIKNVVHIFKFIWKIIIGDSSLSGCNVFVLENLFVVANLVDLLQLHFTGSIVKNKYLPGER